MKFIYSWFESRFWVLMVKEMRQILRDKRLLFLLIVLPTVQLLSYGLAINPDVHSLKLGLVDYAKTYNSRELVSTITENGIFIAHYSDSEQTLSQELQTGEISVGLIIPPELNRHLHQGHNAQVQVLVDAVNANTAGIVRSYINQMINYYSQQINPTRLPAQVQPQIRFLYNPGLISSWFFVSGIMGVIMTLVGSIVSSATVVREKESGTLEQLLITPAEDWEILFAKVLPLSILLLGDVILILSLSRLIFGITLGSNVIFCLIFSSIYILIVISMGILIGTMLQNQQQTQLVAFSINVPLGLVSGAITPIESMPLFFQYLSLVNPLRHYIVIVRGFLIKGVGIDVLWPNALALCFFSTLLLLLSTTKFRSQLNS
ncbi:ABC transporter permease [uncultured Nostoc sp.]|uniref:ABC transporter permease n=1 Tax=uncultured Nostoc sp. TaxID=340711 RepID=UPI0035C99BC4